MRLTCPLCGPRDLREFTIKGSADHRDPLSGSPSPEAVETQLYLRANPAGPVRELWYHQAGCRQWLIVSRDTVTHAISGMALLAEGRA